MGLEDSYSGHHFITALSRENLMRTTKPQTSMLRLTSAYIGSLSRKNLSLTSDMQSFNILADPCSRVGWFKNNLIATQITGFLAMRGPNGMAHCPLRDEGRH